MEIYCRKPVGCRRGRLAKPQFRPTLEISMPDELPGNRIGPYQVVQRIAGQTSEVYLARGPEDRLSPRFMLVLFEVREVDARIIETEVERCKRFEHPYVTRPVELLSHRGKRVLVVEGAPGTSLDQLTTRLRAAGEQMPDVAAFHVGHCLFSALDAAHSICNGYGKSAPLVHGQLGPHQLMIAWSGALRVMGFGMSRVFYLAERTSTLPAAVRAFIAPEQRAGHAATPRSNVYSAAAIVWSLLTSELPPSGDSKPPSLSERRADLPTDLAETIDQALEPLLTKRIIASSELAAVFAEHARGEGQRELRWVIDLCKGLGETTLDRASPGSLPLSGRLDELGQRSTRTPSIRPFANDPDAENLFTGLLDDLDGAGTQRAAPGGSVAITKAALAPPRPASVPVDASQGRAGELSSDDGGAQPRLTPPPPPVVASPPAPEEEPPADASSPPAPAIPTEDWTQPSEGMAASLFDDGAASPPTDDSADDDIDEDGEEVTTIRPSLRTGALSDAPFVTPSNYPPAIGGPPFAVAGAEDRAGADPGEGSGALGASSTTARFQLRTASVPVKWAAVLVVAVLFAFVAGMIVASGPVRLAVGPAATAEDPSSTEVAGATADHAAPPSAAPAEPHPSPSALVTADASASASPEPETDADAAELPPDRGYLIVHCPERPELGVYVVGKVVRQGEAVVVPCGLVNIRLGTFPLGTWYGRGKSVPVTCRSVTQVTMKAGEPMDPGHERGLGQGPWPAASQSNHAATTSGAPPTDTSSGGSTEPYED